MKTQYYTAASLDGFIATTDDSLEWLFHLGDVEESSWPRVYRPAPGWRWAAIVPSMTSC